LPARPRPSPHLVGGWALVWHALAWVHPLGTVVALPLCTKGIPSVTLVLQASYHVPTTMGTLDYMCRPCVSARAQHTKWWGPHMMHCPIRTSPPALCILVHTSPVPHCRWCPLLHQATQAWERSPTSPLARGSAGWTRGSRPVTPGIVAVQLLHCAVWCTTFDPSYLCPNSMDCDVL
jgi:hypothetical protein